jgi:hypothetical protein
MSTKKSTIPQPFLKTRDEPRATYKVGQKVYVISYHKGRPEELLEGEVVCVIARQYIVGNGTATESSYAYTIRTYSVPVNEEESKVYPNYTEAAKVFAKAFLYLLK